MVQPTARPPFPGIKPDDLRDRHGNFTPETVSEGISRTLRLHFEDFRRTPTAEEIAALQTLILNHASRHTVPASPGGEDPIDLSDLFDRQDVVPTALAVASPTVLGRIKLLGDLRGRGEKPTIRALQGFPLDMTGTVDKRGIVFDGETIRPSHLAQMLVADVTVSTV